MVVEIMYAELESVSVKFIKTFSDYLIEPLLIIFRQSNCTGIFLKMKNGIYTSVPKKGHKQNIASYRSIVKNSILEKCLTL